MKKIFALVLSALLLFSLAACNDNVRKELTETSENTEAPAAATEITALLSSPAQASIWNEIADAYRARTGVTVRTTTVSGETYAEALQKQLDGDSAPAIFELNAQTDPNSFADRATDLKGTSLVSFLSDDTLAGKSGDTVMSVPIDVVGYGILYNEAITDRYFALENKNTSYASMDEINSFAKLKALAEDIQAHKSDLGIEGAFSALPFAGTDGSEWQESVANVAVWREANENDGALNDLMRFLRNTFDFTYSDNARDFMDLTVANADADKSALEKRSAKEAQTAFAAGKTAFLLGSTELSDALLNANGSTLKGEQIGILPLYLGTKDEEHQGVSVRVVRALAVNKNADADHRQAAVDFLEWLFSSVEGKKLVAQKLKLRAPMNTFEDNERMDDPLSRTMLSRLGKNDSDAVPDVLTRMMPTEGLENVSSYLLSYVRGDRGWDDLMKDVRDGWNKLLDSGKDLLDIDGTDRADTTAPSNAMNAGEEVSG